jgi:hypothetical protein
LLRSARNDGTGIGRLSRPRNPDRSRLPSARRAEAEARRAAAAATTPAKELGGRDGPEPVRYGDWEVKGIASDF